MGVTDVRVFGSVARGEERPDSDVDLLVRLPSNMGLIGVARLERVLEELLEAPVEVIPDNGLKSDVSREVRREAVELSPARHVSDLTTFSRRSRRFTGIELAGTCPMDSFSTPYVCA